MPRVHRKYDTVEDGIRAWAKHCTDLRQEGIIHHGTIAMRRGERYGRMSEGLWGLFALVNEFHRVRVATVEAEGDAIHKQLTLGLAVGGMAIGYGRRLDSATTFEKLPSIEEATTSPACSI